MAALPPIQRYVDLARKAGAVDAKLIATESVITAQWVRLKCQFGCDGYGRSLTCPPYSPTPERTALLLREYRTALLVHADGHGEVTAMVADLERRAFLDGYYKALALGAGPCELCRTCPPRERGCRFPDKARPAMEACGIDVYQTARNNGFPIEVVTGPRCAQNYYGLVLLE
jgi:predicted metal-binding protein